LGEFEQGRVLLELIRETYKDHKILLSFYSPSGYEIRKNYNYANVVVYLPNDTISNAKKFVKLANPCMTFFIKYEFWYNYLAALRGRKVFQVSLILRKRHYLIKPYSAWFRKHLQTFTHFFVQDEDTAEILKSLSIKNLSIIGDTRFDRTKQIVCNAVSFPLIEKFSQNRNVLLLGSSWQRDEEILFKSNLVEKIPVIIAPHCIDETHIRFIQKLFPQSLLYSELNDKNVSKTDIIIINSMGLLSSLYRYCHWAYIGGGFGVGIHNTLEAAAWGKPICFGPNYTNFKEALDLIKLKGARSIKDSDDLNLFISDLFQNYTYTNTSTICTNYVNSNTGASRKIMEYLKNNVK